MYTRREAGLMLVSAVPAAWLMEGSGLFAQGRPNSRVNGVTIGMNVPYNFGGRSLPVDEIIKNCVALGISAVELRTQPVEAALGLPDDLVTAATGRGRGTPEDAARRKTATEEIRKWRLGVAVDKARDIRRRFDDAGIAIEIVKVDGIFAMVDAELDYVFTLAKTLGARALSTEIANEGPERVGKFADKHQLMIGYHGHAETGPAQWERVFAMAKHNGANLDIGHFIVGNKTSPVPFLKQHHARITHIHVKDRTLDGRNVPFGTGDTPIKEVLQLIRDNRWNIQATIEFEYPVPAGSDRMTELQKCVDYCRSVLA